MKKVSTKGMEVVWWQIAVAIIVIIVLVFSLLVFNGLGKAPLETMKRIFSGGTQTTDECLKDSTKCSNWNFGDKTDTPAQPTR